MINAMNELFSMLNPVLVCNFPGFCEQSNFKQDYTFHVELYHVTPFPLAMKYLNIIVAG